VKRVAARVLAAVIMVSLLLLVYTAGRYSPAEGVVVAQNGAVHAALENVNKELQAAAQAKTEAEAALKTATAAAAQARESSRAEQGKKEAAEKLTADAKAEAKAAVHAKAKAEKLTADAKAEAKTVVQHMKAEAKTAVHAKAKAEAAADKRIQQCHVELTMCRKDRAATEAACYAAHTDKGELKAGITRLCDIQKGRWLSQPEVVAECRARGVDM